MHCNPFLPLHGWAHQISTMAKILNPLGKLRAAGGLRSWELQQLWKERRVGRESGIFYALLAGRLIRTAEPFLAYDVVQEGLHLAPRLLRLHQLNLRLHRLLALALAESGAPWSANQLLKETHARHPADSETLCLMGRTHKDLA